ncbi:hypothetical protein BCR34DRAFT_562123 [Clohesyomyces aquaticus]|uniref:2EXR domain-containing protein n=1 Tax=Clohesyomyces aquaticus TaxID=1231657 RepID=A0A1Y1ZT29_9PLEO|nr:hypothetical protein BCR34DRAFT_562123 [Clohesyomyces aquaticus]
MVLPPKEANRSSFMSLPAEIRLMIYEFLPIRTRHYTARKPLRADIDSAGEPVSFPTLVIKSMLGVSILATCRLIRKEALPVLKPKLEELKNHTASIILDNNLSYGGEVAFRDIVGRFRWHAFHVSAFDKDDLKAFARLVNKQIRCFPSERATLHIGIKTQNPESRWQEFQHICHCLIAYIHMKVSDDRNIAIDIQFRPILGEGEKLMRPTERHGDFKPFSSKRLDYGRGKSITWEEWNDQWAEGERL